MTKSTDADDELWQRLLEGEALSERELETLAAALATDPDGREVKRRQLETDRLLRGFGRARRDEAAFVARTVAAFGRGDPGSGGGGGLAARPWLLIGVLGLVIAAGIALTATRSERRRSRDVATTASERAPVTPPKAERGPSPSRVPQFLDATSDGAPAEPTVVVLQGFGGQVAALLAPWGPIKGGWFVPEDDASRCLGNQHFGGMRIVAGVASGREELARSGLKGFEAARRWLGPDLARETSPGCLGQLLAAWAEAREALLRGGLAPQWRPKVDDLDAALTPLAQRLARPAITQWLDAPVPRHPVSLVAVGAALLASGSQRGESAWIAQGKDVLAKAFASRDGAGLWPGGVAVTLLALRHLHAVYHLLERGAQDEIIRSGTAVLAATDAAVAAGEPPRPGTAVVLAWVRALHDARRAQR